MSYQEEKSRIRHNMAKHEYSSLIKDDELIKGLENLKKSLNILREDHEILLRMLWDKCDDPGSILEMYLYMTADIDRIAEIVRKQEETTDKYQFVAYTDPCPQSEEEEEEE